MGGKDWMAEARKVLSAAAGENDNDSAPTGGGGVHFHGPVTMINLVAPPRHTLFNVDVLRDRINRLVREHGEDAAEAFCEELGRQYGVDDVALLSEADLGDLLGKLNQLMRIARVMAVTPKR